MKHREIWSEQNYKFGRVDPTPWIPLEVEKPSFLTKLWRGIKSWVYTR
jgi:hypothetical protein